MRASVGVLATALLASSCTQPARSGPDPAAVRRASAPAQPSLAEARTGWPDITVKVAAATRTAGLLEVRVLLVNDSQQPFELANRFASDPADRGTLADAVVVEESGLRKYFVLLDRGSRPASTVLDGPVPPGERREVRVRFPAPPGGTSRITIQIPHVPPLSGVVISP